MKLRIKKYKKFRISEPSNAENSLTQSSKSNSQTLGGSVGTNGYSANIGFSEAESSLTQTNFINSQITANNGSLNMDIGKNIADNNLNNLELGNANLSAVNITAKNINMNIANNLNLQSKQNLLEFDSYAIGVNVGLSANSSGNVSGASLGFNNSDAFQSRGWVDNQTSIIGATSVNINVGNNTNIKGAMIANATNASLRGAASDEAIQLIDQGNLTLNTKTLTYSNINNYNNSESNNMAINLQVGSDSNKPTSNGNLNLSLNLQGSQESSTTNATIGNGIINIADNQTSNNPENLNRNINQSETNKKTIITSDMNAEIKIDTRFLAAAGNAIIGDEKAAKQNLDSYKNDVINGGKELGKQTQTLFEAAEDLTNPIKEAPVAGTVFYNISPIEQLAHTFVENDSKLYFTNTKTGEAVEVDRADLTKNYAVNGIQTDLTKITENYLNKNPELTVRHNPTHGMVGDLLESGLGKLTDLIGLENAIAMNRYVAEDMNQRKDLTATIDPVTGNRIVPTNLFHSQGTIIGKSAMDLYAKTYANDKSNQIDNSQRMVAVGPAVLKEDWGGAVKGLELSFDKQNDYRHDPLDPVRYATAPSNVVNQVANLSGKENYNSSIYIPNPIDPIYAVGLGLADGLNMATGGYLYKAIDKDLPNIEHHDVKNPYYQQPLQ